MADPVSTLWATLGASSGFHEVRWHDERDGLQRHWVPVGDRRRFERVLRVGRALEVAAVPRRSRDSWAIGPGWCLWAKTQGKPSLALLEAFRPVPTLILREGRTSRLVALWALSEGLEWDWLDRANKRLAHRLRSPKMHGSPGFLFHPPGCVLRGAPRRLTVNVAYHNPGALYRPREVVGGLRDAPDPEGWRERAA